MTLEHLGKVETDQRRNQKRRSSRIDKRENVNISKHETLMEMANILAIPCVMCGTYHSKLYMEKRSAMREVPMERGHMEKAVLDNAPKEGELLRHHGYNFYWDSECRNYVNEQKKIRTRGSEQDDDRNLWPYRFVPREEINLQTRLREEDERVRAVLCDNRNEILELSYVDLNISPSTNLLAKLRETKQGEYASLRAGGGDAQSFPPARNMGPFDRSLPVNRRSEVILQIHGFTSFKSETQRTALESLLNGKDTLLVEPTGGGKSFVGQGPALEAEGKITIFIAPLISLNHLHCSIDFPHQGST